MVIFSRFSQIINNVLRLYEMLDAEIAQFQAASALRCASGCGRCCENPKVVATVLEVLPLAYHFWEKNSAQAVLAQFLNVSDQEVCVFYQPDPLKNGQGRCGVYLWRPLLCRLFGFAAQKDKYGQPQLVTCSTMKSLCSYEYEQALENMHQGKLAAPLMQDYAMRLFNIDPHWGKEQLPINQAIKIALEKVGLLNEKEKIKEGK